MDVDELEPRKPKAYAIGEDLSKRSVAELDELMATLKAEIRRIEEAIDAKRSSRAAADSVFKS